MRWNCPHCGVSLAISDDKMGNGWSFSRCYKCGGFALIRRAEVNLVKVDRAPAGEHIILPEAAEEPMSLLSDEAAANLARLRRENAENPASRAAAIAATQMAAPIAAPPVATQPSAPVPPVPTMAAPANPYNVLVNGMIPPPPPEAPKKKFSMRSLSPRIIHSAIGIAAFMTVASGVYLYIQGQALWAKARNNNNATVAQSTIRQTATRPSEVMQAPAITDQVRHNAMAPIRATEANESNDAPAQPGSQVNIQKLASNLNSAQNTPKTAPAQPVARSAPVQQAQPAPQAAPAAQIKESPALVVQPKGRNASLHAGPGSLYPTVGLANPGQRFIVADWNDRWFKILMPEKNILSASAKSAWIRTDLVQVVQANAAEKLPEYP